MVGLVWLKTFSRPERGQLLCCGINYHMFDYGTIKTISWGILGIAGLLLAISRMRFEKRLDWRIGIGIPLFGISLFVLTTELPQYGIGFSILGTLIMAGAALMAIRQRDEQVKIDRRERKLITIIEWAIGIVKCETADPLPPFPIEELLKPVTKQGKGKVAVTIENQTIISRYDLIIKAREANIRTNLIMRYQDFEASGKRIVLIAKMLDKQFSCNLGDLAQETSEILEAHVNLGSEWIKEKVTDDKYEKHWRLSVGSAKSLAEKAEEVAE